MLVTHTLEEAAKHASDENYISERTKQHVKWAANTAFSDIYYDFMAGSEALGEKAHPEDALEPVIWNMMDNADEDVLHAINIKNPNRQIAIDIIREEIKKFF